MIRFSIFGIPVEVQPFFWVLSALLGGALGANSPETIFSVVLFILAAFISILIHELGHALTGIKLGGGSANIVLTSFGGLAYNHGGRFNPAQRFWMVFAGPGAGFAFFIVLVAALSLFFGGADVMSFTSFILFGKAPIFESAELLMFLQAKPFIFIFLKHLLWINFWWGIINLLPIMPLDGGQITEIFVKPQRTVFIIGMVAACIMAALGLIWLGSIYTAVLFAYLAWTNYQNMQASGWR